jgi:hypothetical protein
MSFSKVKTIVIDGEVAVMGQSFPSTTTLVIIKVSKMLRRSTALKSIQCFTPDGGWMVNPMMAQHRLLRFLKKKENRSITLSILEDRFLIIKRKETPLNWQEPIL